MTSGLELIPQREPFLLIDGLVSYTEEAAVTSFEVKEGGLFIEEGALTETGILENMAQSSAARIGYIAKYITHTPVRIGYIGAVKDFVVHRRPKVGEILQTRVHVIQDIFDITLADVEVRAAETIIATATLKTALANNPEEK